MKRAPGPAELNYGAPLGLAMTSQISWIRAEMTSHDLRTCWGARSEGHPENDFRHVDVPSECHTYKAAERPTGMAWSGGQAGKESGCSLEGPKRKRRRDDVAADMEPRAKRGAYAAGHPPRVTVFYSGV